MKNWVYPLIALSLGACSTPLPSPQPGDKTPVNAVDAARNAVLVSTSSSNPAQQLLVPTPQPSALASTPTASTVPSVIPATPMPTALASPTPSPSVTFPPFAEPDNDRSVKYLLRGKVLDLEDRPVKDVLIEVVSVINLANHQMDPEAPFSGKTITNQEGYYELLTPLNTHVKIKASKLGFSTRTAVFNPSDQWGRQAFGSLIPEDDSFHFADLGSSIFQGGNIFFLNGSAGVFSNGPEVIKTFPTIRGGEISQQSPIRLTFNKAMNITSVENAFVITAGSQTRFRADGSIPFAVINPILNAEFVESTPLSSGVRSTRILWDKRVLNFQWNSENTEVTVTLKPGYSFPTNHNLTEFFSNFAIYFNNKIEALDGSIRNRKFFGFEPDFSKDKTLMLFTNGGGSIIDKVLDAYFFIVSPDTILPSLSALNAHPEGLSVEWSEQMLIPTLDIPVAGGMAARRNLVAEPFAPAEYPLAPKRAVAANYSLRWPTPDASPVSWQALGGRAVYDTSDVMYRRVLLKAPINSSGAALSMIPALRWAATQALATIIQFDTQDNSTWQWGYRLVKADGSLSAPLLTPDLETESSTAAGLASALQSALNAPERSTTLGSSANPWQVRLSADQKQLELRFLDQGGQYLGWVPGESQIQVGAGDSLPSVMGANSLQNWSQGQPFQWFTSGENVSVEVATTVIDPAGNSVDPAQRSKSTLLP